MKSKSFTLIELLVVIVIIGILAGVIIVSVSSSINKANFAKAQSFSNTVQNELLGDLVSEWTFNSPAVSGKTEDSWGNNDGTLYGANGFPQLQTKENCVYGTCYSFDGVDDYINVNNPVLGETEISICSWVKKTAYNQFQGIVSDYNSNSYRNFILGYENPENTVTFYVGNGTSTNSISKEGFTANQWHFVCGIFKGGDKIGLYIDGFGNAKTTSITNIGNLQSTYSCIGRYSSSYRFSGLIDDVRIYKAALSSSQIKQQYVAGLDSLLSKNLISQEEYNQNIKNLALR